MSQHRGNDMTTEDSSQDKGHSESPTLPTPTENTDIDKILTELQDANVSRAYPDNEAFFKAKAAIEQKLNEARISELTMLDNNILEITPELFHDYYIKRVAELSALQASKEGK